MSRFTKLFAANAIAAAGLGAAAIALSPCAAADPIIPPVVPGVPGLGMIQQLASNPAGVGAVLQTAASALSGASSIIGGPAASSFPVGPAASSFPVGPAASTLPISPIEMPGALPGALPSALPGMLPGAVPGAPVVAPMIPGQSLGQTVLPLLNQFGIPGSLANLAPSNMPFPIQIGETAGATPAAPLTAPAATAPIAGAPAAGGTAFSPLSLLNALP